MNLPDLPPPSIPQPKDASSAGVPKVRHTFYSFRVGLDKRAEADLRDLKALLSDGPWKPSSSLVIRASLHVLVRQLHAQADPESRQQQRQWVRSLLKRPA